MSGRIPGEFKTDSVGRTIVSYSSITKFRNCRRDYYWSYIRHLEPLGLRADDPRVFGSCMHAALEALRDGRNAYDVIDLYWRDAYNLETNHEAYQWHARSIAAMNGYRNQWLNDDKQADFHWDIEALEGKFNADIINPATDNDPEPQVHQGFSIVGVLDLAVRVHSPCVWGDDRVEPGLYLGELKTWASIDDDTLKRLWTNFQILLYAHYLEDALGEPVRGVLYDVIGKAKNIKHTEGESQSEFEERRAEFSEQVQRGDWKGQLRQKKPSKKNPHGETDEEFFGRCVEKGQEKIAAMVPEPREPDEDFHARLAKTYANPNKYHRGLVVIDPRMVYDVRTELWETLLQHAEAEGRNHWGKNETTCAQWGKRLCDFWQICTSFDNPTTIEENYRIKQRKDDEQEQTQTATAADPRLPIVE